MTNEVTVITGASSGIGAALAKQLGSKGHQLVLAARREKELKEVAKQAGTIALVVPTDVTRRVDVEDLRSQALKQYGHVDVWVNNAGRGITKSVLDLTDQDVDEITSVVLKSVLYGMQAIIPHFQERGRGLDQRLFPSRKSSTREPPVDLQRSKERGQRTHRERAHGPQSQVCRNSCLAGHAWNGRDRFLQSCQHAPITKSRQSSRPDNRPVSGGSRGTDCT